MGILSGYSLYIVVGIAFVGAMFLIWRFVGYVKRRWRRGKAAYARLQRESKAMELKMEGNVDLQERSSSSDN